MSGVSESFCAPWIARARRIPDSSFFSVLEGRGLIPVAWAKRKRQATSEPETAAIAHLNSPEPTTSSQPLSLPGSPAAR